MNVIFYTKYTRKGASSRLRTYQYIEFLQAQGITCTISPFFSDRYLAQVYKNKTHNKWQALVSFVKRLSSFFFIFKYDKVVIEKEFFPFFPAWFERIFSLLNITYIVDYDDAIWHNYDMHPNSIVKNLLHTKIMKVMRYADSVVAGNEYIKQYALKAGAKNVIVIPTVVDVDKYQPASLKDSEVFTIGWIGSPITFKYLPALKDVFEQLGAKYPIRLNLIGANSRLELRNVEECIIAWSEDEEAGNIQKFDVGIMPLDDNIWERGKCGYKLIQYMACGVPVIGTPIGVNDVIIKESVNGFKVSDTAGWSDKLEYLIIHKHEREKMGSSGRIQVENHYSLQVFKKTWLLILSTANKDITR